MTKVSIVVPVYNAEKHLTKCLSSIQDQTFTEFEVILVNDGSTDNSFQICKKFCDSDHRFYLIDQPNGGVSKARNAAIDFARSKYLAFVDADDYIEPHMLSVFYHHAEDSNADLTIASHLTELPNGETEKYTCPLPSGIYTGTKCRSIAIRSIDMWSSPVLPFSGIRFVKRACMENPKLRFNPNVQRGEDYLLWTQVFFHITRLCVLSEQYLYHYTDNKFSITHSYVSGYWNMVKQIYKELCDNLPQQKDILKQVEKMLIQRAFVALNICAKAPTNEQFLQDFSQIVGDKDLLKTVRNTSLQTFDFRHQKFYIFLKLKWHSVLRLVYLRKLRKFRKNPGLRMYR